MDQNHYHQKALTLSCKKHVNVKFSKGHLSAPKPKSEDIEKSINRMKKW